MKALQLSLICLLFIFMASCKKENKVEIEGAISLKEIPENSA